MKDFNAPEVVIAIKTLRHDQQQSHTANSQPLGGNDPNGAMPVQQGEGAHRFDDLLPVHEEEFYFRIGVQYFDNFTVIMRSMRYSENRQSLFNFFSQGRHVQGLITEGTIGRQTDKTMLKPAAI